MDQSAHFFEQIARSNRAVSVRMEEIVSSIQEVSTGSQEVSAALINLADCARQSSEHTRVVAGSVEEMLTSMEQLNATSSSLNEMAVLLKNTASIFRVD